MNKFETKLQELIRENKNEIPANPDDGDEEFYRRLVINSERSYIFYKYMLEDTHRNRHQWIEAGVSDKWVDEWKELMRDLKNTSEQFLKLYKKILQKVKEGCY